MGTEKPRDDAPEVERDSSTGTDAPEQSDDAPPPEEEVGRWQSEGGSAATQA